MINRILFLVIFVLSISLVGCGNPPIQIEEADPEKAIIDSEILNIRNCDSNDEMLTTLAAQAPVRQKIDITDKRHW